MGGPLAAACVAGPRSLDNRHGASHRAASVEGIHGAGPAMRAAWAGGGREQGARLKRTAQEVVARPPASAGHGRAAGGGCGTDGQLATPLPAACMRTDLRELPAARQAMKEIQTKYDDMHKGYLAELAHLQNKYNTMYGEPRCAGRRVARREKHGVWVTRLRLRLRLPAGVGAA